jgi:hypothetical protein
MLRMALQAGLPAMLRMALQAGLPAMLRMALQAHARRTENHVCVCPVSWRTRPMPGSRDEQHRT